MFIAGSGTEVGKTYVTASLTRQLYARGRRVRVCKPLASGLPAVDDPAFLQSDPAVLLAAQGRAVTAEALDACSPWRFTAAFSPDMAAAAEGRSVGLAEVVRWTQAVLAEPDHDDWLVEGVGGVMSPITGDATGLDLAVALGLPVLLVCGSYLGAISHGLTALEALRGRRLEVAGAVVNAGLEGAVPLQATLEAFRRFTDAPLQGLNRGAAVSIRLFPDGLTAGGGPAASDPAASGAR